MSVAGRLLLSLLLLCAPLHAALAKDSLTIALQIEPPNLDPTSGAAVAIDEIVYASVFEGLVRAATDGTIQPLLASSWTVSPDGRVYLFRLRDGVRFHDGTPLTAADVVFSLDRAIAPKSSNAQAQALSQIAAVSAPDSGSVRIELKAPDSGFLTLLSLGDAVIVSPRSAAALATAPIGTGPFKFEGWRRGDAVTLARNPAYWRTPARLARVTFRFIADPTAAYAAVRAHDIDIFPDFPAPETLAQLRGDRSLKLAIGPTEGEVILSLNERTGPLSKLAVRRAIAHVIDRRAIIDGAMFGYGTPIGSHFPPQSPDYVDLIGRYPRDIATAKRLLAEAGYPNGFAATLKLPPQSYARRTGEILAAQFAQVGIRLTIRNLEWAGWLDEVFARHDFDMTIVNHAEPFDYEIYGRTGYYFGYESPEFRALLAELKRSGDPASHRRILQAIQRKLADDAVNGFLFQFPHLGVQDATLSDIWVNTPNQALDLATAHFAGGGGADAAGPSAVAARGGALFLIVPLVVLLLAVGFGFGARYLLSRLAVLAGTLLAATILIFALIQVVPGDPAAYMMGLNASPQAIAALHADLGLEGSIPSRYLSWLGGLLTGDFGTSYTYRVPVGALLAERLAVSLPLALLATLLSIVIGIPAGYLAARRRGGAVDTILAWAARLGIALPSFWLAILLVLVFSVTLRWVAAGGFPGWSAGIGPALGALALPTLALAVPQAAILARVTRGALIGTMAQDYVRTARAKGLSHDAALLRHALPNALGPVLTVLGLQVPFLLAGSAIIEAVFFLPGVGRLVLQAIAQRDLIVVQSVVVVLVAVTVFASFLVDVAYAVVDPRLRDRSNAR
jgi:ABC-type dipeptide/oligopeptide/nickel transport system permease component/ABC-type transport system substrate-binding protein